MEALGKDGVFIPRRSRKGAWIEMIAEALPLTSIAMSLP